MRRLLFWYLPIAAAIVATLIFAAGFISFLRGDTGTPVDLIAPPKPATQATPRATVAAIIVGDSLARGTGDETGLGIGGRLANELKERKIPYKPVVNIAINGARTPDLLQQLQDHNVGVLLGQANTVIMSIGGNDLWGGTDWRRAPPRDPDAVMGGVLDHIDRAVRIVRADNPRARIFFVGLYNPFVTQPFGRMLTPLVTRWNARLQERFASDPNFVVVQTSDIFAFHDRLSVDRFHPASEGYALIARRIADAI
jgi:lysophospholipase L1-like esterase